MHGAYAIIKVMFMERFNAFVEGRENKIIAILGGICGLSIVVIAICLIVQALGNATIGSYLSLNIAPSSAKITINGKDYRNGVWEFPSGQYSAVISADGFESKTISFKVDGGTTTVYDYIVNKNEGMKVFEKDETSMGVLRHMKNDEKAKEYVAKYDEKVKIKDVLPLQMSAGCVREECDSNQMVTVENGSNNKQCKQEFCLRVVAKGISNDAAIKNAAERAVKMRGYSLDDYEVIYEKKK